jgi:hypothetical protein
MKIRNKVLSFVTLAVMASTAARGSDLVQEVILLDKTNPLALALNAILPVGYPDDLLISMEEVKAAAVSLPGGVETYFVKCSTQIIHTRTTDPIAKFKGCSIAPVDVAPNGIETLTLGEVLEKAVALNTPPKLPNCPRCAN